MSKGAKKLLRSARHKKSGKYLRQFDRTAANKARRKARLFNFRGII